MDNNSYIKAAEYIKSKIDIKPTVGIILGSGIGDVAENVENPCIIPYSEIQDFPISTVKNHLGRFVIGKIANKDVIVMQGRVHFYEGYNMAELAIPIQTLKAVGVETLIVTNTSGGINESYNAGEIVIINDHIKFDLDSPLRGENHSELGDRFFDMTQAYSPKLRKIAKCCGEKIGLDLKEGVYAYTGGPQFETPAEIRMLRMLGGDLVGMSSVPEVITAVHCGIEVLGLSCITNMAAGMKDGGLNRDVIYKSEEDVKLKIADLLIQIVESI